MTPVALWLIKFYQRRISRFLPSMCRFTPTCSEYAAQAIRSRGFWVGTWLAAKRIARCNPLCKGGYDPVPPVAAVPLPPAEERLNQE
jgi:putative membrane protein insertion efficiency factor